MWLCFWKIYLYNVCTIFQILEKKQGRELSRSRIGAAGCTVYLELVFWPLGVPADPSMLRVCMILNNPVTEKQLSYNIIIAHYDIAVETKKD